VDRIVASGETGPHQRSNWHHRHVYAQRRLHDIRSELKALHIEKSSLSALGKQAGDRALKDIIYRRIYVVERIAALRAEQERLAAEAENLQKREKRTARAVDSLQSASDDEPGREVSKETVARLIQHVRSNELNEAKSLFNVLASAPANLERHINFLQLHLTRTGHANLLLDWLVSADPKVFTRLFLIAKALELGKKTGAQAQAAAIASQVSQNRRLPLRWGSEDRISRFGNLGKQDIDRLCALKYRNVSLKQPQDLLVTAEKLSNRMTINRPLLDFLYSVSKHEPASRNEWEKDVRTACCIDHIIADMPQPSSIRSDWIDDYDDLIDERARDEVATHIRSSPGILLVTFHGGFFSLLRQLYAATVPGGLTFGIQDSTSSRQISAKADPGAALFLALRAMQDGKTIIMAPDAKWGALGSTVNVARKKIPMADGAAFLAYESGRETAWYGVELRGQAFVPVLVSAPRPHENEKYAAFKQRWLEFYARQIEATLTGDPKNISLRARWISELTAGGEDQA
jgi:uncharacterized small protein (DUF1192 family)